MQQPPPWRDVWAWDHSDDDVRAQLPNDHHEFADGIAQIGVDEALTVPPQSPYIASRAPARVAREHRRADAEGVERRGQFAG